jgi:hypothetical protein
MAHRTFLEISNEPIDRTATIDTSFLLEKCLHALFSPFLLANMLSFA